MTSYWKEAKRGAQKELSKAAKGRVEYWNGKHFSKEHRKNISKDRLGTHIIGTRTMPERSLIHRRRISRALKAWWKKHKQKEARSAND